MASFLEGFATGFLRDQTDVIRKRKDEGEEYFNKQLELARTRGLHNRDITKKVEEGNLQIAKQLQANGVPSDLVMSIAKQNPDDLPAVLAQIQQLKEDGHVPDEKFYRSLYKTSQEYKAPDQDMSSFMRDLYEPLRNNAKADPNINQGSDDSIWATMFGSNAMDRARQKLDTTIVADGMTASELLAYNEEPDPNTGGSTVTLDSALVGDATRAAKERLKGADMITPQEALAVNTAYDKALEDIKNPIQEAWVRAHPEDASTSWEDLPEEVRVTAARKAADEMVRAGVPRETLQQIPKIMEALGIVGDTGTPPPAAETTTVAPTTELPPVAEDQGPPPGIPYKLPNNATFVGMYSDGSSAWVYPDGHTERHSAEDVNKMVGNLPPQNTDAVGNSSGKAYDPKYRTP